MGTFLVFILKASVCLTVFYGFYKVLLSRETFHRFNRAALLSILLLSMLIPLCELTLPRPVLTQPLLVEQEILRVMAPAGETPRMPVPLWPRILLLVYAGGVALFSLRFLLACAGLYRLMRRSAQSRHKGVRLILTSEPVAPFSWMNYVVISQKDWDESGEEILAHETAHIRNGHSLDLLLAQACVLLHWFNPAAWLLRQELQHIHEYEADEAVLRNGVDAKKYQLLLIKKAAGAQRFTPMASSFNHSSLKKRIAMMLKRKSHSWARLKYLYVLPLAASAIVAFARPEISRELEVISNVKLSEMLATVQAPPDTLLLPPEQEPADILREPDPEEVQQSVREEIEKAQVEIEQTIREAMEAARPEIDKAMEYVRSEEMQQTIREAMEAARPEIDKAMEYVRSEEMQQTIREAMEAARPEIDKAMEYVHSEEMQQTIREAMEAARPEIDKAMEYVRSEEMQQIIREAMEAARPEIEKTMEYVQSEEMQKVIRENIEKARDEAARARDEVRISYTDLVTQANPPLILLDGKEISGKEANQIPGEQIEFINILKSSRAIEAYGDKAANGVVLIELKKEKE
ncbi:MAG: hypothetical protein LBS05_11120 [Tannerellaceae bacterium]|jgi:hypothetical protein|nr:hypothetical protein [Tannerellaceae bacterium]